MTKALSISELFASLVPLQSRRPTTTAEEAQDAFAVLSPYRDGAIYIGEYDGNSEWERHSAGDEIVYVLEGSTTLFFLEENGAQSSRSIGAGELLVVPQGQWHRFETPRPMKVLTVTPQPTDHSVELPEP